MKTSSLYTTALHVKLALRDGAEPPMTRLPESALKYIDPALTIGGNGWGGLVEREGKLVCPVKRCGLAFASLAKHVRVAHGMTKDQFKSIMGIPRNVALITAENSLRRAENYRRQIAAGKRLPAYQYGRFRSIGELSAEGRRKATRQASVTRSAPNNRNLLGDCEAQVRAKISLLQSEIGRTPVKREFRARFGARSEYYITQYFGTWNNALAQCGLPIKRLDARRSKEAKRDGAIEALRAWVAAHGDLPSQRDAMKLDRTPRIPSWTALKFAFEAESWPYAMEQAAAILGIEGGRYGLPVRQQVSA